MSKIISLPAFQFGLLMGLFTLIGLTAVAGGPVAVYTAKNGMLVHDPEVKRYSSFVALDGYDLICGNERLKLGILVVPVVVCGISMIAWLILRKCRRIFCSKDEPNQPSGFWLLTPDF